MTDLERIEKKHRPDKDSLCVECWLHHPCDVVKLARALDKIARMGTACRREIAERTLEEVAG